MGARTLLPRGCWRTRPTAPDLSRAWAGTRRNPPCPQSSLLQGHGGLPGDDGSLPLALHHPVRTPGLSMWLPVHSYQEDGHCPPFPRGMWEPTHTDHSGFPQTLQRGTPFCQSSPRSSNCGFQTVGSMWRWATPTCAQPLEGASACVLFLLSFTFAEPAVDGSTLLGGIAARAP